MCVMSMIMSHQEDEWQRRMNEYNRQLYEWYIPADRDPSKMPVPPPPQEQIDEFNRLLERARKYDLEHQQKDCEMESKKETLRKLAKQLGITQELKFE